ncbi:MAG: MBL fold metallo-hydrolase [Phycisphaerales bacterium]|nr:MBL fold metallo-hydrolase [Phycisphaerales bacterium]MBT7170616.1 MBL fold metallo-hydrolase [Phycisphaerales bacterium]
MMRLISLQSGSNGNCLYLEGRETSILIDAGISGKQAQLRLGEFGRDIRDASGVILTHDHADHSRSAGIVQRKFGMDIWASPATFETIAPRIGKVETHHAFRTTRSFRIGEFEIEPIATPHDAADGCGFIIASHGKRLGILTDLGTCFDGLGDAIATLDAVVLESNYDPGMLSRGPYPYYLKQRITSPAGHISNAECGELLRDHGRKLQWAALGHLSGQNNTPDLARKTSREIVGDDLPLHVLSRDVAVGEIVIE